MGGSSGFPLARSLSNPVAFQPYLFQRSHRDVVVTAAFFSDVCYFFLSKPLI